MDDPSAEASRLQDNTRWLLVVLVGACVLAAGILAVSDVAGLVGRRWQVVGATSTTVTVLALVVGLLGVLRAMGPGGDGVVPVPVPVPMSPQLAPQPTMEPSPATRRRPGRSSVRRPRRSTPRSPRAAPLGPGRRVRRRHRRAAPLPPGPLDRHRRRRGGGHGHGGHGQRCGGGRKQRAGPCAPPSSRRSSSAKEDGPITEPQAVAVQLTTPGLRRVAEAMGCPGAAIGPGRCRARAVAHVPQPHRGALRPGAGLSQHQDRPHTARRLRLPDAPGAGERRPSGRGAPPTTAAAGGAGTARRRVRVRRKGPARRRPVRPRGRHRPRGRPPGGSRRSHDRPRLRSAPIRAGAATR